MNSTFSMDDAWALVVTFNQKYFPKWRERNDMYISNALAGEVGEVCNMTKHRAGGGTSQKEIPGILDLMDELADVFIYTEMLAAKHGFTANSFAAVIKQKVNTNIKRMEEKCKQEVK